MNRNKLFLYSLASLAVTASHIASAEQLATAPTLEGGITASIGTFYAIPAADNETFSASRSVDTDGGQHFTTLNNQPNYDWGWDASLGYVFEDTANGIELSYRGFNTDNDNSSVGVSIDDFNADEIPLVDIDSSIDYELNAFDLMISQYLDVGRHMQVRLLGGLSYVELEQKQSATFVEPFIVDVEDAAIDHTSHNSKFTGWGPRVGLDARYEFGPGFGIVGGGSVAYYLGDLDTSSSFTDTGELSNNVSTTDDSDNHAVANLRANLGIDYVYFFEDEHMSTLGIELGYFVDYYNDSVGGNSLIGSENFLVSADTYASSFSGPYLNLKGVF